MKKLYALALAGVMTVAMAMPVLAAPSPAAQAIESAAAISTSVSGIDAAAPSQALAEEVVKVTSNAQVLKDLNVPEAAKLTAVIDVSYSGEIPAGGVQIPFVVSSAKAGDLVYVLHRQATAPYTWEVVGQAVLGADLTVTGTFTSFSPVAFLVVDATNVAAGTVKAPKTGEF